jgi:hypothetical protein
VETCTAEFARLSASLPGLRCDSNLFVTVSRPNATMPSRGQIGSLPYSVVTFVLSVVLLTGAYAGTTRRTAEATAAFDNSGVTV